MVVVVVCGKSTNIKRETNKNVRKNNGIRQTRDHRVTGQIMKTAQFFVGAHRSGSKDTCYKNM